MIGLLRLLAFGACCAAGLIPTATVDCRLPDAVVVQPAAPPAASPVIEVIEVRPATTDVPRATGAPRPLR